LVRRDLPALDIVVTGKHASFVDRRWHEYDESDLRFARQQLERLHSSHLEDRLFGTLSTGEKQRVLIARSLMTHPKLLLLDEAMTGLDLGARERLVGSLSELASDPASPAVVLVTHHVEEIPPGFTHIVIMAEGKVLSRGPMETTLSADALSECFGQPLLLERTGDRFHAWSSP
jgi:iron complex transport system ATP-binding protein